MKKLVYKVTAYFLIAWFPCFIAAPVYAQWDDDGSESLFTDEGTESENRRQELKQEKNLRRRKLTIVKTQ